ncbi:radical SAM protein [bacterium]|nr:radical SAM protein [bacterium]
MFAFDQTRPVLVGNGAEMQDRITRRPGSYIQAEAAIRAGQRPCVGVVRDNAFMLDKLLEYACGMVGRRAPSIPALNPSPVADLPERFRFHLDGLKNIAVPMGIQLEMLDGELEDIFATAASLADKMPETDILRLLGIVCRVPLVGPHWFVFEVENACNEDCIYCNIHAKGRRPGAAFTGQRMDFDVFARQIDDLARMGTDGITVLANGEPTVHPNFLEMIQYAKGKGLRVNFFTNGLLMKEKLAKGVVDAGCDEMFCTISGATEQSFLAVHPKQKAEDFEQLMRNLKFLTDYKKQQGSDVPRCLAVHVICRPNFHELPLMAQQAVDLGFDVFRPQLVRIDPHNFPIELREDHLEQIRADIPKAKAICEAGGIEMWAPFEAMVASAGNNASNWTPDEFLEEGCPIGWSLGLAKVTGDLSLCCVVKPVGNLRDGSIGELWFGEDYQRYRLGALYLNENMDMPLKNGTPLYTYRCLRCDNHDINRQWMGKLRDSGLIRYYRG